MLFYFLFFIVLTFIIINIINGYKNKQNNIASKQERLHTYNYKKYSRQNLNLAQENNSCEFLNYKNGSQIKFFDKKKLDEFGEWRRGNFHIGKDVIENVVDFIICRIIPNKILEDLISEGKNVIIPTTGLAEYVVRLSTLAKTNGYKVKLVHIDTAKETATRNLMKRFEDTGRFVDPFFVEVRAPFMRTLPDDFKNSPLIDEVVVMKGK